MACYGRALPLGLSSGMAKFGNGSSVSLEERDFLGSWATLIFWRRHLLREFFNQLRNYAKHINLSAWCFFSATFVSSSFVCNPIYKYGYWFYERFIELRTRTPVRCYTIVTINYSACTGEDWQSELKLTRKKRPTTTWLLRLITVFANVIVGTLLLFLSISVVVGIVRPSNVGSRNLKFKD